MKIIKIAALLNSSILFASSMFAAVEASAAVAATSNSRKIDGLYETINPLVGAVYKISISDDDFILTVATTPRTSNICNDISKGAYGHGKVTNMTDEGFFVPLNFVCADGSNNQTLLPLRFAFPDRVEDKQSDDGTLFNIFPHKLTYFKISNDPPMRGGPFPDISDNETVGVLKSGLGGDNRRTLTNFDGLYETIDPADGAVFKITVFGEDFAMMIEVPGGESMICQDVSMGGFGYGKLESVSDGFVVPLNFYCGDGTNEAQFDMVFTTIGDAPHKKGTLFSTHPIGGSNLTFFNIGG